MPNIETDTRYIHARFALANKNIYHAVTSFVSLLLESLRYIKDNWKMLVKDIENGTVDESIKMPNDVRESLLEKIEPMLKGQLNLGKSLMKALTNHLFQRFGQNSN